MLVVLVVHRSLSSQSTFSESRDRTSTMDEPEHQPRDASVDLYPPIPPRRQEFEDLKNFIEAHIRETHNSVTGRIDSVKGDIQSLCHMLHTDDGRGISGRSNATVVSP